MIGKKEDDKQYGDSEVLLVDGCRVKLNYLMPKNELERGESADTMESIKAALLPS
jgi:hypothetical protein